MAGLKQILDPRKRKSGTSLVSTGSTEAPKGLEKEQGSSIAAPLREVIPDLGNKRQELRTYYQMSNMHAASRASLRAVKSYIMGAEFYMEPASDEDEDQLISEFVEYNIFEAMTNPWLVNLQRIAKFCDNGSSVFETVWGQRDWARKEKGANHKTYMVLTKLAPRPLMSITKFEYDDNGGPIEIVQQAIGKEGKVREEHIPIQKAIIFPNEDDTGDLFGKSMLRSAYPHWFYIQHLYKVDAIQKERHGTGVPKGKIPPGIKEADRLAALELLKNIRTNEHAGILEPLGYEFSFMDLPGNVVDVIASINHHNAMIMLNVLAEFLVAGISEGGARATSASQQDVFTKANKSLADIICDSINQYLIPYIVGYNFDTDRFPKLHVRNIGESREQQQLAAALGNLFAQNILTPDMPTEQHFRKVFQIPRKLEDRPLVSDADIKEIINLSKQLLPEGGGGTDTTGGINGKTSTTPTIPTPTKGTNKPGGGNTGKGNNVS